MVWLVDGCAARTEVVVLPRTDGCMMTASTTCPVPS